jgi:hypothetical protein
VSLALQAYLSGSAALVPHDEAADADDANEPVELGPVVEMLRAYAAPVQIESKAAVEGGHRIEGGIGAEARFALAGNARFTLVSTRTGARFTFRVRAKKDSRDRVACYFVSVLTGPDNTSSYEFLGTIFATERVCTGGGSFGRQYSTVPAREPKFSHGKKSRIGAGAPSAKAFAWWWARAARGTETPECEVWHLGRCGRCGRDLTVPESIACGLGPECASKGGA